MTAKIAEIDSELATHSETLAKKRLGPSETRALWRNIDELLEARFMLAPTRKDGESSPRPASLPRPQ